MLLLDGSRSVANGTRVGGESGSPRGAIIVLLVSNARIDFIAPHGGLVVVMLLLVTHGGKQTRRWLIDYRGSVSFRVSAGGLVVVLLALAVDCATILPSEALPFYYVASPCV